MRLWRGRPFVLPAVTGLAVAALTLLLATILAPLVLDTDEPWLIVLAALSIPFATIQLPLQHVLQGFEDVGGQNVVYVVYSAVFTVAAVTGAYVGGVYGAVVGLAIGNAVLAALYLVRPRDCSSAHVRRCDWRAEVTGRCVRFCASVRLRSRSPSHTARPTWPCGPRSSTRTGRAPPATGSRCSRSASSSSARSPGR